MANHEYTDTIEMMLARDEREMRAQALMNLTDANVSPALCSAWREEMAYLRHEADDTTCTPLQEAICEVIADASLQG